jgi:anti-sigma factor RsiW
MLPEHLQELLTASIDGELTAAERRMADKLLRESDEARKFHARLAADSERLRRLPPAIPAEDLSANVLGIIADKGMSPTPLPMPRRRRPSWNSGTLITTVSLSSAAVLLIAIGIGSYLYFASSQQQTVNAEKNIAKIPSAPKAKDPVKKPAPSISPEDEQVVIEIGPRPRLVDAPQIAEHQPTGPEMLPEPRIKDIIASPVGPEASPLVEVKVRLTLLLPLHDLDQDYPRKALRTELKKDEVVHLDLFCKDSARAAELLQAALKSKGQQIVIDAIAQDLLKKKHKSEYVFYTESLTADEIAALLEQIGAEDKKAEAKRAGEGQFDKFNLSPFHAADQSELCRLLGVSPAQLKLPKPKGLSGLDPTKSLESNTASRIAATLPKSASRIGEKLTIVLANGQIRAKPENSKEIKSFLEKRGERRPDAVPMMLVLRTL